jgi:lysozyme
MSKTKIGIAAAAAVALSVGIIKPWEGVETTTYLDIAGIPTVCYGQTGQAARIGATYTLAECEAMLGAEVARMARELDRCIRQPLEPHEAAAVLSWAYNVGTGAACRSTLVRKINAGEPGSVWCAELDRWNRAGGREVRGLTNRRAYERAVCEGRRQP